MKKIIPYLSIVLAMLIWAGAGIAVQEALVIFTPMTLIVGRFSIAVLLMCCLGLVFQKNAILGLQRLDRSDIPLFILGGLFQPFLYFIFETYTYQSFASPTIAEALLSTQPVMAPLFAFALLRERVTRNNIVGIILSTIGVLMLLMLGGGPLNMSHGGISKGVILALLTVSMSVSYSVVLRRIPKGYSPLSIVFYVQSFALILFYILWFIKGENSHLSAIFDAANHQPNQIIRSGLAVGYLAVLASVTAFILFCYTVRKIGVTRANVFNNIRPVFTALLMWLIFGEVLPIWKIIGIIIIIIGLFISQKQEKEEKN